MKGIRRMAAVKAVLIGSLKILNSYPSEADVSFFLKGRTKRGRENGGSSCSKTRKQGLNHLARFNFQEKFTV